MARALVDGWSRHKLLRPNAKMRLSHHCPEALGKVVRPRAGTLVSRLQGLKLPSRWVGLGGEVGETFQKANVLRTVFGFDQGGHNQASWPPGTRTRVLTRAISPDKRFLDIFDAGF